VVSKFVADSPDVLRGRTVNLTVLGSDFENPTDKLVLKLEYVIGGSTDWESLPSAQTKVTYDAKLKLWNVVYTPTKDNYLGIYHIRASLKDLDNTNGPSGDLQGNLLVNNNPPKVKFTAKTSVTTGEVVTFDGRDTTDPEDLVTYLKFEWDFKDGGKATSSRVSHAFNNPGTYEVTVKVTDRDGGVSTAKTTVTVTKGSVLGPGGGLGLAIIAGIVVLVVVVVVIMLLVLRKKQKGPFKKRK
jgi:surface-anchored protein